MAPPMEALGGSYFYPSMLAHGYKLHASLLGYYDRAVSSAHGTV